ncbi:MAG: ferrous iron transport protein A [Clostridia bacterium]|nr:ferrous iron transport protein A [Clostridia bacterium]
MTLNELKKGQSARITGIDLLSFCALRLIDLGFVPGTSVAMLARAPFGDPMLVQVRRHTFMLRKAEAQYVWICTEENA